MLDLNKIYVGHVIDVLKTFPDKSINMVMTSPPYWALRNYKTTSQVWGGDENCEHEWNNENVCIRCNAWNGELGAEPTFDLYVNHLCDIFDEINRVLRDDGGVYINIGDTYGTKSGSGFANDNLNPKTSEEIGDTTGIFDANELRGTSKEMHKNLCNIPARFSIEMQNRGWTLRNEIIWHKNNVMPSSANDRYTVDFEKIYFFTKKKKYYFKQQFEPYKEPINRWGGEEVDEYHGKYSIDGDDVPSYPERKRSIRPNSKGRNKRTVWNINTKPFKDAHFATYNVEICESPIDSCCPLEQCTKCGKPIIVEQKPITLFDYKELEIGQIVDDKPYAIKERVGYVEVRDLPKLEELKHYLNKKKAMAMLTIKEIEETMESQAPHHWFSGESYPTVQDWWKIKELLDFDDVYDARMTEVKYKRAEKCSTDYVDIVVSCDCNAPFEPGVVLDPFMGSGTTGIEAINQGKNYVGIELNEEYAKLAVNRINDEFPYFGNDYLDTL